MLNHLMTRGDDAGLWERVRLGDETAFAETVRRHQSAVSAVAYSVCGELSLSEDAAQEAFWTAWRRRTELREPSRARAWICGIARNIALNLRRRARPAAPLEDTDAVANAPDVETEAIAEEEQRLVRDALAELPDDYREPLVLFYREGRKVIEVAAAMDLSEDAVKQRLARGRAMLRDRMAELVESALSRSRPGAAFTSKVMAGLTAAALVTPATASAAAGGLAGAGAKGLLATVAPGVAGSALGVAGGLIGGWFGTWAPTQMAETVAQRDLVSKFGRRIFLVSLSILPLTVVTLFLPFPWNMVLLVTSIIGIQVVALIEALKLNRQLRELKKHDVSPPNDTPMLRAAKAIGQRYRGRRWRSRMKLLGLPLVDINVADPTYPGATPRSLGAGNAKGWIAIGDVARGVLFAMGGVAFGGIAIGGLAIGGIALGGGAVGLVALGGGALGGLAIGGLGIGLIAVGGGAIGWQLAAGGGALAWHDAVGGGAVARDHAVGGGAWAAQVNNDAAKAALLSYPGAEWLKDHFQTLHWWFMAVIIPLSILPTLLLYRRATPEELAETAAANAP
jgi:RNA polymerase sigma factor (sigma-70 family)